MSVDLTNFFHKVRQANTQMKFQSGNGQSNQLKLHSLLVTFIPFIDLHYIKIKYIFVGNPTNIIRIYYG
jgi:hypothetical protein